MDLDELFASLSQPEVKKTASYKKQEDVMKISENVLGGYLPSNVTGTANERRHTSVGFSKPTQQQNSLDDVLKIFEDQDQGSTYQKKESKTYSGGFGKLTGDKTNNTNKGFFEEFDFDDIDTKYQNQSSSQSGFLGGKKKDTFDSNAFGQQKRQGPDTSFKDKRDSLFGIQVPSKTNQNIPTLEVKSVSGNFAGTSDGFSAASREKDSSAFDIQDDFSHTKQMQTLQKPLQAPSYSNQRKSILDDNDDFPTIEIQNSRRGRSASRRTKDEKSTSPPLIAKTTSVLNAEEDSDLNSISLAPKLQSKQKGNLSRDQNQSDQRPPRLLKSHEESGYQLFGDRNESFGNFGDNDQLFGRSGGGGRKGGDLFDGGERTDSYHIPANPKNAMDGPTKQISYDNKGGSVLSFQPPRFQKQDDQEMSLTINSRNTLNSNKEDQTNRNADLFNKETVSADFYKNQRGGEQFKPSVFEESKRQVQEEVTFQLAQVRDNYENQIKIMKKNYEDQLEYQKKLREETIKEMQELLKSEKERMKIVNDSQIQSIEEAHTSEKEQLKRQFQIESDMLKRQLEQQIKMANIAEDIKINAHKLDSIQNKLQDSSQNKGTDKEDDYKRRELQITENENKLKMEQEYLEKERNRIHKQKEDLDRREIQLRTEVDGEKLILKREYGRLSELQDKITNSDLDMKRQFGVEKHAIAQHKVEIQEERLKLKEEYELKYKEFEMEVSKYQLQQNSQNDQLARLDSMYKQKIQEAEELRGKLLDQEQLVVQKFKAVEIKEIEVKRREMDCLKIEGVSGKERREFEDGLKRLREQTKNFQEEQESILQIRNNFGIEREKLENQKNELVLKERKLQHDQREIESQKRELQIMQRTVDSLKRDVIKDFNPQKINAQNNIIAQEDVSIISRKENPSNASNHRQARSFSTSFRAPAQGNNRMLSESHSLQVSQNSRPLETFSNNQVEIVQNKPPLRVVNPTQQFSMREKTQQEQQKDGNFNLNEFLTTLKVIDQNSNFNQAYISKERENLFVNTQLAPHFGNSSSQHNAKSGSYTQSQFCDSSPYLYKPQSSGESHFS